MKPGSVIYCRLLIEVPEKGHVLNNWINLISSLLLLSYRPSWEVFSGLSESKGFLKIHTQSSAYASHSLSLFAARDSTSSTHLFSLLLSSCKVAGPAHLYFENVYKALTSGGLTKSYMLLNEFHWEQKDFIKILFMRNQFIDHFDTVGTSL